MPFLFQYHGWRAFVYICQNQCLMACSHNWQLSFISFNLSVIFGGLLTSSSLCMIQVDNFYYSLGYLESIFSIFILVLSIFHCKNCKQSFCHFCTREEIIYYYKLLFKVALLFHDSIFWESWMRKRWINPKFTPFLKTCFWFFMLRMEASLWGQILGNVFFLMLCHDFYFFLGFKT